MNREAVAAGCVRERAAPRGNGVESVGFCVSVGVCVSSDGRGVGGGGER